MYAIQLDKLYFEGFTRTGGGHVWSHRAEDAMKFNTHDAATYFRALHKLAHGAAVVQL